ncbi:hypothetical protein BDD12DRAFT_810279 [Trichophaea hybrida]|nr:hypothetical protein BDD12DRAFT_810279 [Trichophaea hybrida]
MSTRPLIHLTVFIISLWIVSKIPQYTVQYKLGGYHHSRLAFSRRSTTATAAPEIPHYVVVKIGSTNNMNEKDKTDLTSTSGPVTVLQLVIPTILSGRLWDKQGALSPFATSLLDEFEAHGLNDLLCRH